MQFKNNGSNENGNYIKYANGIMICYGIKNSTLNITNGYEGDYYTDTEVITFPIQFVAQPSISTSIWNDSSLIGFNISAYTNSYFQGYVWKSQAKSNVPINLHYIAIGRWK